jgi:hypothetical protein
VENLKRVVKKRKKQVPPYIFNHLLTFPFPMYSLNS